MTTKEGARTTSRSPRESWRVCYGHHWLDCDVVERCVATSVPTIPCGVRKLDCAAVASYRTPNRAPGTQRISQPGNSCAGNARGILLTTAILAPAGASECSLGRRAVYPPPLFESAERRRRPSPARPVRMHTRHVPLRVSSLRRRRQNVAQGDAKRALGHRHPSNHEPPTGATEPAHRARHQI